MATNVRAHRINYAHLAARGAVAGAISASAMAIAAMTAAVLSSASDDAATFPTTAASLLLGTGTTEIGGGTAPVVTLGLALHLLIGGAFGALFGLLVGYFDIEEPVPVILGGLMYGVAVYLTTFTFIANLWLPQFSALPVGAMLYSHILFGLIAGALLGNWQLRADLGTSPSGRAIPAWLDRDAETIAFITAIVLGAIVITIAATAIAL